MNFLIRVANILYPILCVFVPCIIYQIYLYRKNAMHEKINKGNLVWRYVFILYLYLVMNVVGMGSVWDIGTYDSIIRLDEIKLVPFQSEGIMTYVLNMIMLMPLGFLLPLIWEKYRKISETAMAGLFFSLSIELGQLFNRRSTEVDDLLMNVLGTMIGFGIWLVFNKILKTTEKDRDIFRDEPFIYMLLSILGTFLLYNWRLILNYA